MKRQLLRSIFNLLYAFRLGFLVRWSMYLDFHTLRTPFFMHAASFLYEKGEAGTEFFVEKCIETILERKNTSDSIEKDPEKDVEELLFVESMRIFFNITNNAGFRPFLAFGSLLGFVREKKFITWDKDLDICFLLPETDVKKLEKLLSESGFKILISCADKIPYIMKCRLSGDHPVIDIAFFIKKGDKLLTYGAFSRGSVVRYRTPFSLQEAEYYGVKIRIPENPEIFLTENYGDWRSPRRIHHWVLDSRLTDYSLPHIQFLAKEYFLHCLIKNDTARIRHYLNLFSKTQINDPFWKKINTAYGTSNLH